MVATEQSNAAVSPSGIDNKELVVPNPENITASHGEVMGDSTPANEAEIGAPKAQSQ